MMRVIPGTPLHRERFVQTGDQYACSCIESVYKSNTKKFKGCIPVRYRRRICYPFIYHDQQGDESQRIIEPVFGYP